MSGTGHVFVVRGRMENLDHDASILPTDDEFSVTPTWAPALGATAHSAWDASVGALRPRDWPDRGWGRAVEGTHDVPLLRPTWFVDVAHDGDGRASLERMVQRVAAALRDIARADLRAGSGRPRPLVAVPTLGVGGGGFGAIRGEVIDRLLRTCQQAVRTEPVDVVVVAFAAADHAAFQARRRERGSGHEDHLGDEVAAAARRVAGMARDGSLALFLGAGVSISAGLPSWADLLAQVAADAGVDLPKMNPLDKAELLRVEVGERLGELVAKRTGGSGRYGLNHALLASFGAEQVVTTNYDDLYERAARDGDARVLPVLPFEPTLPRAPWLLKMHGDASRPATIVLSRSDFVGYDASSRPMGAMVQALLLTKHLLVVGASLTDDNFLRLAHEVLAFQASGRHGGATPRPLGTVVSMRTNAGKERLWRDRFEFVATSSSTDGDDGAHARRLAIFLDAVAMHATPAAHLANARYAALLDDEQREIAALARELRARVAELGERGESWAPLVEALEAVGAVPAGGAGARTVADAAVAEVATPRAVQLHDAEGLHVWAELRDGGALVVQGQDLRGGEYEYAIEVAASDVPAVVRALGGSDPEVVLDLLTAHAATIVGTGERQWFERAGVPVRFWSRHD